MLFWKNKAASYPLPTPTPTLKSPSDTYQRLPILAPFSTSPERLAGLAISRWCAKAGLPCSDRQPENRAQSKTYWAVWKHSDFYDILKFSRLMSILLHENIFFKNTWSSVFVSSTPYLPTRISIIKWKKRYKSEFWNTHTVNLSELIYEVGDILCSQREFPKERGMAIRDSDKDPPPANWTPVSLNPLGAKVFLRSSWINYFLLLPTHFKDFTLEEEEKSPLRSLKVAL